MSIKCLFNLALRQSLGLGLGLVESVLRLAGLDWRVPDFSTVCRRQKTLRVQLPYRASTTALDLLVDSTGIKFLREGEWKRNKYGAEYRRHGEEVGAGLAAVQHLGLAFERLGLHNVTYMVRPRRASFGVVTVEGFAALHSGYLCSWCCCP